MEGRIGILTALLFYTIKVWSSHSTQQTPMDFSFTTFVDPSFRFSLLRNDSISIFSWCSRLTLLSLTTQNQNFVGLSRVKASFVHRAQTGQYVTGLQNHTGETRSYVQHHTWTNPQILLPQHHIWSLLPPYSLKSFGQFSFKYSATTD